MSELRRSIRARDASQGSPLRTALGRVRSLPVVISRCGHHANLGRRAGLDGPIVHVIESRMISRVAETYNGKLSRVIDGLADPTRRRRAALTFVLGYGALWFVYAVIAKSSQDINADIGE